MINCDQYSEPIASDDGWFKAQIESYKIHKEYAESLRQSTTAGDEWP